jgi:hypothetical protein
VIKNNDRKKKDSVIWLCTYVGNNGVGNGHFFFLDVEHTTINIPQMTWHRETHRKPSEEYSISSNVELGFLQDMKPGPQGVRSLAKLGSPCQDMKPGPQGVPSLAKLGSPHQDMNPGPQGVQSLTNLGSPCQDMKPGPQGLPRLAKVGSPCQDMRPGPRELTFRKNLDLRVRHETQSTGQIDVLLFLPRVRFTRNHPIFTRN